MVKPRGRKDLKRSTRNEDGAVVSVKRTKKVCAFCEAKTEPTYTDSQVLRKYLSDRTRILPKMRTGACSKHQRAVTLQIKYARHLALLPFVNVV